MNALRNMPPALRLILLISAIVSLLIGFDLVPVLRGGEIFSWRWPYEPVSFGLIMPFILIVMIYLIGVFWIGEQGKAQWVVLWSFIGAIALSITVIGLRHPNPLEELYFRTLSPTATGPYYAASIIDWDAGDWKDWPVTMIEWRDISQHVALSPPGLPLLHNFLNGFTQVIPGLSNFADRQLLHLQCNRFDVLSFTSAERAGAIWGMLMPFWAALAVFPLYLIARRMIDYGSRWLVSGWALVPALMMFAPSWNTFYPLLTLIAFWMLLNGLDENGKREWFAASGFITGLLTFFNFSTVPLALLFGMYTLLHTILNQKAWKPALIAGAYFGIGAIIIWLIFGLWTGSWPWAILATAFDKHLELERAFWPWLWMHSWEWALLSGLPFIGLWLVSVFRRQAGDDVLPQALFITMIILLLSNTARGETGRVWLFFTPFVMLSAGQMMRKWNYWSYDWLSPMVVQALLLIALASTWNVMEAGDIRPVPDAPSIHADVIPTEAHFGDEFTLTGWSAHVENGTITLNLNWQSHHQMTTPYFFAALPVAPDGSTGEAVVWQADQTRYPTTCWLPDATVGDTIQIMLPENAQAGNWYISLTAFANEANPLQTIKVTQGTVEDRQIGLGPILVGE